MCQRAAHGLHSVLAHINGTEANAMRRQCKQDRFLVCESQPWSRAGTGSRHKTFGYLVHALGRLAWAPQQSRLRGQHAGVGSTGLGEGCEPGIVNIGCGFTRSFGTTPTLAVFVVV